MVVIIAAMMVRATGSARVDGASTVMSWGVVLRRYARRMLAERH